MGPAQDVRVRHLLRIETAAGLRLGHQHRPDRGFEQGLRVQAFEPHDLGIGEFERSEANEVALADDVVDARGLCANPQPGDVGDDAHRLRVGTVAVDEFVEDLLQLLLVRGRRKLPIGLESQPLVIDVLGGQVSVDGQFDAHIGFGLGVLTAELRDRLTDEPDIEVEAHPLDVSGLLTAQQVAGPADLEVLHRHLHARTQLGVGGQGRQPIVGGLGQLCLRRVEEVGIGPFPASSHPAAQLVELREAEAVGVVDDQRVRIRDVDAGLDDGRAHEHVVLLLPEVDDDLLEAVFVHLAVGDGDPRLGHEFGEVAGHGFDVADPVVDVEDLALAHEFASDRGLDLLVLAFADIGQHRVALLGRSRQGRHLTDPGHRHLQGARDRGRRHREHVDVRAQRLERLLVLDAEALLLVDDDEPEVLESHLSAEQPVGADDEVEGARREILLGLLRGLFGLEA